MELPKEEGAYLFYFGNNEQFYDIDEVLLDDEGNPYLLAHYATGTPTHWWHLPEPNEHFKTDYEVVRNAGIQEGIERGRELERMREYPVHEPDCDMERYSAFECPECTCKNGCK